MEDHHHSLSTWDQNEIPPTEDNTFHLLGVGIRARILGIKVEDKVNIKDKIKASLLPQNVHLEVVHKTSTVNHQLLARIKNQQGGKGIKRLHESDIP